MNAVRCIRVTLRLGHVTCRGDKSLSKILGLLMAAFDDRSHDRARNSANGFLARETLSLVSRGLDELGWLRHAHDACIILESLVCKTSIFCLI